MGLISSNRERNCSSRILFSAKYLFQNARQNKSFKDPSRLTLQEILKKEVNIKGSRKKIILGRNWIYRKRGKSIRSGRYVEKCKKLKTKQKLI